MAADMRRETDGISGKGFSSVEVERLTRKRRSEEERETVDDFRGTDVVVRVDEVEMVELTGRILLRSALLREGI